MHIMHCIIISIICLFYIVIRWGIVGVTEQYILGKTERMRYLKEVELIAGHIGRICDSTVNHDDEENISQSSMSKPSNTSTHLRIESEKE